MHQSPSLIFAVDGGASKTQAQLRSAQAILATAQAGPCNLYQDPDGGIAAIQAAWRRCCADAGLLPDQARQRTIISAGLAGVSVHAARLPFETAFSGFAGALLSSDGYAALVGAVADSPGALISVGTGVVGCRFDAAGRFVQLSGWGFPVGDQGGGAWIGLRLVSAWLDHRDGVVPRPDSAQLWHAVADALGDDRATVLASLRGATPGGYARLAPLVLASADQGDRFAESLLNGAAAHLAALAQALASPRLALGGGLAAALRDRLEQKLEGSSVALDPIVTPDPLEGAWRIAQGLRPPEFTLGPARPPGHHSVTIA